MKHAFPVVVLAAAITLGSAGDASRRSAGFFSASAAAQTNEASVENVALVLGPTKLTFKRVEVRGGALSGADLAKIFAADAAEPAPERLTRLSAETVVIPELVVETQLAGSTQKFTYRDVVLSGVVQGRAREVTAGGASFVLASAAQGEARGAYGRMSARDVDLILLARMAGNETSEQPQAPLYRDLSIEGVHFETATLELDAEKVAAGALWLASSEPPAPALSPDATSVEKEKAAQAEALRRLQAFRVEKLEIANPALTLRSGDSPVYVTAAGLSLPSFEKARADSLVARSIVVAREGGDLSIASAALEGVDLAALLEKGDFSSEAALARPVFTKLSLSDLAGKSPDGAKRAFSIRGVEIRNAELPGDAGARLDVALDGLDAPVGEGALPALAALGYDRLDLSGRFSADWRSGARELSISDFSLDGARMGRFRLSALFGGVSAALASPDQEKAASAARNVVLKTLNFTFVNDGLVDKALAAQAERQKVSVDEARESAMMQASLVLPALMGNAPPLRLIGSEAARFIAEPNSFNLVARSPQGVGLRDFELVATPAALLKKVEITAYANR